MNNWTKQIVITVCFLCCVSMIGCSAAKVDLDSDVSDQLTETLHELYPDEGWHVAGQMTVDRSVQTFSDPEGNQIFFYTLSATAISGQITDEDLYRSVIDSRLAETVEHRQVGVCDAMLYTLSGRAYLCWRPEETVALILEYDPLAVSEADMIRMAESAEAETDADQ